MMFRRASGLYDLSGTLRVCLHGGPRSAPVALGDQDLADLSFVAVEHKGDEVSRHLPDFLECPSLRVAGVQPGYWTTPPLSFLEGLDALGSGCGG